MIFERKFEAAGGRYKRRNAGYFYKEKNALDFGQLGVLNMKSSSCIIQGQIRSFIQRVIV